MDRKLLLASNSPRRRELLTEAGFEFDIAAPTVTERLDAHLTLRELTLCNALRKGVSVAEQHPEEVVLSADTLVGIGGEILGKPTDRSDATRMLGRLNGRVHQVCSAVFICCVAQQKTESFYEISHVRFHRLSTEAICRYLDKLNPLDKAGAYAAQDSGTEIIDKIEGSYSNVVGLPMERTTALLAAFGIKPKLRDSARRLINPY